MKTTYYARFAFVILLVAVFVLPIVARGARQAVENTTNDVKKWLPEGFEETRVLDWFREHFLGEQFVLVSWKGCTLDDPRLETLAKKLVPAEGSRRREDEPQYFKSVITGRRVLDEMTDPDGSLGLSRKEAIRRLSGSLIGPDGETTCLVATLTQEGQDNLRLALGNTWPLTRILFGRTDGVIFQLAEQSAIDKEDLMMGGPPVDNVAIDDEGEITLMRLAGLSGLVGLITSWFCFRSRRVTAFVFCSGIYSAMISMAIVWYSGGAVDAVMMSMPSVVYVLGLSGAIHLVNYYKDAVRESGLATAPGTAVRHGWVPCTLAAVTTALGLGSLVMSEIMPIRNFGGYSAAGVLATLLLLLALLPALLQIWPPRQQKEPEKVDDRLYRTGNPQPTSVWHQRMMAVGNWIIHHHGRVSVACTVLMVTLAIGLYKVQTSVQLLKLFDSGADIIQDYTWLEHNIGNLVPMEVVVRVDPRRQRELSDPELFQDGFYRLTFLERLELVERVQKRIEAMPEVGRALAATTFAKLPGTGATLGMRSAYNSALEQHVDEYLDGDYMRKTDEGEELYRISARVAALPDESVGDVDYGEFVHDIRAAIEPIVNAYHQRDRILAALTADGRPHPGRRVVLVGLPRGQPPAVVDDPETEVDETFVPRPLPQDVQAKLDMGETLVELLESNNVKVNWLHDAVPAEKAARFVRVADKVDLVVNLADHPAIDPAALTAAAPNLLDLRDLDPVTPVESEAKLAAVYTGVVPLVYKAQRTLLTGLINSIGLAFVLICVVMIAILRSPTAGLLSMIPNVFPVVVIFGAMGWLGVLIDIGTMMTASVAMGVAVDDTLHFLTWFRRGMLSGLDRRAAISLAYERCASAMLQTTIIGGLGLGVFVFSTFTPTQRFGYLMTTLLAAAILGDLVFLPALLSGPLGKFFARGLQASKPSRNHDLTLDEQVEQVRKHHASPPAPHFGQAPGVSTRHDPPQETWQR
ncbi:MAG: hypothetical protein DWQ31_10910 [Planctomycetota bacterium]|nr:MAG: hypothetical protein DWQ31_10910 [Planctomycetota bacterium]